MTRFARALAFALALLAPALSSSAKDVLYDTRMWLVRAPGGLYGLMEYECAPTGSWHPSPKDLWRETAICMGPLRLSIPMSAPLTACLIVPTVALIIGAPVVILCRRNRVHSI
jgi:hypothetical protein